MTKRPFAIFDLDGCISDDSRRLPLIRPDHDLDKYDKYHEDMINDPIVNREVVNDAAERGLGLLFVTARPEKYWKATRAWLSCHRLASSDLLMRPNGDMRGSPQLKCDLVEAWLAERRDCTIAEAYDDRIDILNAYKDMMPSVRLFQLKIGKGDWDNTKHGNAADQGSKPPTDAGIILREMAATFIARNKVYGDNFKMVGPIMAILFPNGVPVELLKHDAFHLLELAIVKLSRLAISKLTHIDSAHDAAVYFAMIESIMANLEKQK